jgi:hypothetical protein
LRKGITTPLLDDLLLRDSMKSITVAAPLQSALPHERNLAHPPFCEMMVVDPKLALWSCASVK